MRLSPVTRTDVSSMLRELRRFPLLESYRGGTSCDVAALEDVLLRINALAEDHPNIAELDCNLVMVSASGAVVVDARVKVARAEGDTVEIDLSNAADAGVTHSIDLHAATGPGGGAKVMQIAPGEDGSFKFQALSPGVYVYHCATPMVAQHIASGMYGLIVVEPKNGLPKVDHEYYLMEGDFYLQGQRGDAGMRGFDLNKMLDERPDYVLFNGGVGSLTGDNAFKARVGESIRIFFGVGGPNLTSSFHVIGAIFDRVYPEGSLTSAPETNVQTTHVSTGGGTAVEFTAKVPGTYSIVDHSLGRIEKGAAAQIVIEGPDQPEIFQSIKGGSGGSGGH